MKWLAIVEIDDQTDFFDEADEVKHWMNLIVDDSWSVGPREDEPGFTEWRDCPTRTVKILPHPEQLSATDGPNYFEALKWDDEGEVIETKEVASNDSEPEGS